MTANHQPTFSVLTVIDDTTEEAHWQRFSRGLEHQSFENFEVIALLTPDYRFQPLPDRLRNLSVIEVTDRSVAFKIGAKAAQADYVVLLETDSLPDAGLMAAYARERSPSVALIGTELPVLPDTASSYAPEDTILPALLEAPAESLHFSAFRLSNLCVSSQIFTSLLNPLEAEPVGDMASLVAGWRLTQAKIQIRSLPQAVCYISAMRRWAKRLREYALPSEQAALLAQNYPQLAALYENLNRPAPSEQSRVLLYDTIKDYPVAEGMLQGLQDQFEIGSYQHLRIHPLFLEVSREWEARRTGYLQAQLERLRQGQAELAVYGAQVEAACRQQQAALDQARQELAALESVTQKPGPETDLL